MDEDILMDIALGDLNWDDFDKKTKDEVIRMICDRLLNLEG